MKEGESLATKLNCRVVGHHLVVLATEFQLHTLLSCMPGIYFAFLSTFKGISITIDPMAQIGCFHL